MRDSVAYHLLCSEKQLPSIVSSESFVSRFASVEPCQTVQSYTANQLLIVLNLFLLFRYLIFLHVKFESSTRRRRRTTEGGLKWGNILCMLKKCIMMKGEEKEQAKNIVNKNWQRKNESKGKREKSNNKRSRKVPSFRFLVVVASAWI